MKFCYTVYFFLLSAAFFASCVMQNRGDDSPFSVNQSTQGLELLENGRPVFFYQQNPKSLTGEFVCNNYIHPLYGLQGDTLTEEFPEDHPYHRGIFWAWHQIYISNQAIGDSWIMKNVVFKVNDVQVITNKEKATIQLTVSWESPLWENGTPFLKETTTISVYESKPGIRKIDFDIRLRSLVAGVAIGGSEDRAKGYGGFCARIKTPGDLAFTSSKGLVTPAGGQVKADSRMDFSGNFNAGRISGLTILCHPSNPLYPSPWIIRQSGSMQNAVYPGADKVELPPEKTVALHYRLIVHDGNASSIDLDQLQKEYQKMAY